MSVVQSSELRIRAARIGTGLYCDLGESCDWEIGDSLQPTDPADRQRLLAAGLMHQADAGHPVVLERRQYDIVEPLSSPVEATWVSAYDEMPEQPARQREVMAWCASRGCDAIDDAEQTFARQGFVPPIDWLMEHVRATEHGVVVSTYLRKSLAPFAQ